MAEMVFSESEKGELLIHLSIMAKNYGLAINDIAKTELDSMLIAVLTALFTRSPENVPREENSVIFSNTLGGLRIGEVIPGDFFGDLSANELKYIIDYAYSWLGKSQVWCTNFLWAIVSNNKLCADIKSKLGEHRNILTKIVGSFTFLSLITGFLGISGLLFISGWATGYGIINLICVALEQIGYYLLKTTTHQKKLEEVRTKFNNP